MTVTWKKVAFEDDAILNTLLSAEGDILVGSGDDTPDNFAHATTPGDTLFVDVAALGWETLMGVTPEHHASTHIHSGDDILYMDNLVAEAAVDFNGQEATDMIIHETADYTGETPVVGKWVYDTVLEGLFICTVAV
jgi:hypothetical protein